MHIANKNKIYLGIFLLLIINPFVASSIYYDIEAYYDSGDVKVNSINVKFTNYDRENYANPDLFTVYSAEIRSDDRILAESEFNIPSIQYSDFYVEGNDTMSGGRQINVTNDTFSFYLPYKENAKELIIFNDDKEILTRVSLYEFSKDFNDNIYDDINAEKIQTNLNISIDNIPDKKPTDDILKKLNEYALIFLFVLIILVLLLVYLIYLQIHKN